jgi:hypothetical protein
LLRDGDGYWHIHDDLGLVEWILIGMIRHALKKAQYFLFIDD